MKKKFVSILMILCVAVGMLPVMASAGCPFARPEGYAEVAGTMAYTYTVGEEFRTREVSLLIYGKNGNRFYSDHLEFWANGTPIYDGYKFKEIGQKVITVKRYDKAATYELQVIPVLNGKLSKCSIVTPPAKTTYRQTAERFNPKDIVVKCVFTDGTTQNLGYQDLELYAGKRGMKGYKDGTKVKEGYRFVEAGEKDLIIRVCNNEMRIPFTVTPFFTKQVTKVAFTKEPATMEYTVGQGFRSEEYKAQCYYADGTTELFSGDQLNITANSVPMYAGYRFQVADTKKVLVRIGDYSAKYELIVTE